MNKIKIIFFIIIAFVIYKGVVAFKNFEIGVSDKVAEIEELADFEKEGRTAKTTAEGVRLKGLEANIDLLKIYFHSYLNDKTIKNTLNKKIQTLISIPLENIIVQRNEKFLNITNFN